MVDPRSAYREGTIRGATGTRLVVFLYDQIIQDLRRAALAMKQGDIELRTKEINHALLVIGHLQGTLDRERGGQVSRNLDRFYCSVRGRLIEAHVRISKEILDEQISNLLSMREAWVEVDHALEAGARPPAAAAGGDKAVFASAPAPSMDWGKY